MSDPYIQPRMNVADAALFAPDRNEYSRCDAWADLHRRMDYRTGEVRASGRELAAAWGWTDNRVERWLADLAAASYVSLKRLGPKARDGRAIVIERGNQRGKDGAINGAMSASADNDLQRGAGQSPGQKRGNQRGTSKEGRNRNSPPTGERGAAKPPVKALALFTGEPNADQLDTARDLLREWIAYYRERTKGQRPPEADIGKQGGKAKQIAMKHPREEVVQAFHGMQGIWQYGEAGTLWDLFDLDRLFAKAYGSFHQRQDVKAAEADAEFDRLTRGAA